MPDETVLTDLPISQLVLESIPMPAMLLQHDGHVAAANARIEQVLSIPPDTLVTIYNLLRDSQLHENGIVDIPRTNTSSMTAPCLRVARTFCTSIWIAYWRGWEYARHVLVVLITALTAFAHPIEYVQPSFAHVLYVAPVLALVLVGPIWVLGSAVTILVVFDGIAMAHSPEEVL